MKRLEIINELDIIANDSWYDHSLPTLIMKYCFQVFERFFVKNGNVLELGPAEGIMTEELIKSFDDITLLEGSSHFSKQLRKKFPGVKVVNCLFEEFKTSLKFDNILLGHVLEHVADPVKILKLSKEWLSDNGRIIVAVPNANSIHRQAAVKMGLLKEIYELNDADIHHGHRRVYDLTKLRNDFKEAGLRIEKHGGYWFKPLSNKQIEESWTPEMLDAFLELGEEYPDIAAEIYIIAKKQ